MTDGARPHPAFAILVVTSVSAFVRSLVMGAVKIEPATLPLLLESIRLIAGIFAGLCVAGVFVSLARDAQARLRPPESQRAGKWDDSLAEGRSECGFTGHVRTAISGASNP
jgi:hypothetical protein